MYHYHNTKHVPYRCHITNYVYVPIGTENIKAYFQGMVLQVGKFGSANHRKKKNSAVATSHFAFAVFLI